MPMIHISDGRRSGAGARRCGASRDGGPEIETGRSAAGHRRSAAHALEDLGHTDRAGHDFDRRERAGFSEAQSARRRNAAAAPVCKRRAQRERLHVGAADVAITSVGRSGQILVAVRAPKTVTASSTRAKPGIMSASADIIDCQRSRTYGNVSER
jgi:hypothetical protein